MPACFMTDVIDDGSLVSGLMSPLPASGWHQPVMVGEVLECLAPHPGAVFVDGTVGTGGHSLAILPRLLPSGRLVALDRDREMLEIAQRRLVEFDPHVTFLHGNFRQLPQLLSPLGLSRVDGLLVDLGLCSRHVDEPARGFSFSQEGPLDMRMDGAQVTTAAELLRTCNADDLAQILETYGEERFAKRIARRIVEARRTQPITTTAQLARLVTSVLPLGSRHGRLHAATRTFQALRIAVNDELGALQEWLRCLPTLLGPRGRAVVLTFHSLEDRLVKQAFAQGAREGLWTVLTKKPARPTDEEVASNPRARSAKLRAVERR